MIKEPRNLLWAVPLICLISFPLWQPIAAKILKPPHGVNEQVHSMRVALQGTSSGEMLEVDFMQAREDRKEWQIKAARMYSLDGEKDIRLEDVEALFYGKSAQEQGQTRISSRKARYIADSQLLNLQGQVVIRDSKGYEIQTESLNYLDKEKKINTESKVQINGSNISVSGESLTYEVESGNYRIEGNVVCKVW